VDFTVDNTSLDERNVFLAFFGLSSLNIEKNLAGREKQE
jgi:hypothetical protein